MPELPEVETVKRDLAKFVLGRKIVGVEVKLVKYVAPSPPKFKQILVGATILGIERRGKLLLLQLDNGYCVHIHLKMTGQLVLRHKAGLVAGGHPMVKVENLPNKHTHLILHFDNGDVLYCNDQRQFGYVRAYDQVESNQIVDSRYGVEPLSSEFTLDKFKTELARRPKSLIKSVLLDQKIVAGLGNIYVDETCYRAKVLPTRRVSKLSASEIVKIHRIIKQVISLAVKHRGTTFNNYVSIDGQAGQFWRYCKVYGRAGQLCGQCSTTLVKAVVAQRGTTYCPKCQL